MAADTSARLGSAHPTRVVSQLHARLQAKPLALYLDLHHTLQASRADALVGVANVEACPGSADPAGAGLDADHLGTAPLHFNLAAEQLQSLPAIGQRAATEAGLGIEFQADALGQFHPALFADIGDVVGSQPGNTTGHRGADQQESCRRRDGATQQRPAAEMPGRLHRGGGRLQPLPQRLGLFEGPGMFGALPAPQAQGPGIGHGGAPRGQQDQPVSGLAGQSGLGRGVRGSDAEDVQAHTHSRKGRVSTLKTVFPRRDRTAE